MHLIAVVDLRRYPQSDEAWRQPIERPWTLSDPNKKVNREFREAKLTNTQKNGLGRLELRLEFVPRRGAPSRVPPRQRSVAWSDHSLRPEDVPDSASVIGVGGGASARVDQTENLRAAIFAMAGGKGASSKTKRLQNGVHCNRECTRDLGFPVILTWRF